MNQNIARSEAAWPPQKIAELTRLYQEGLTMNEIGRRMGISKSTVIGKVSRLGLVRGESFVPSKTQAERLKAQETLAAAAMSSTLHSRLGALHAALDAVLARARPAPVAPVKATDNATRPFERRRSA